MIVGEISEVPEGRCKSYLVDDRRIAVFHVDGHLYAIEDRCTHAEVALSDGWIDGKCVACPWHGAQFDLETGEALSLPATGKVNTYPVRQIDGKIDIELPDQSLRPL